MLAALGDKPSEAKPGSLQVAWRSLAAAHETYRAPKTREEIPDDVFHMVAELATALPDLLACYPQIARLEAERESLRILDQDVSEAVDALSGLGAAMAESDAFDESAVRSIREINEQIKDAGEDAALSADPMIQADAHHEQARLAGYQFVNLRAMYARILLAASPIAKEAEQIGAKSWKELRPKLPNLISSMTLASLVTTFVSPTLGALTFCATFRPIRDRAKQLSDIFKKLTGGGN